MDGRSTFYRLEKPSVYRVALSLLVLFVFFFLFFFQMLFVDKAFFWSNIGKHKFATDCTSCCYQHVNLKFGSKRSKRHEPRLSPPAHSM